MNYEQKYKEALERMKIWMSEDTPDEFFDTHEVHSFVFPELKENEDEKIRKEVVAIVKSNTNDISNYNGFTRKQILTWLEKQKVTETDNLEENDKPRWLIAFEEEEKDKQEFVGDGFIRCKFDFPPFKEGEHYWLEYVGNNYYNVRSDNLLGQKVHISGVQLYTVFQKLTWLEKQKPYHPVSQKEAIGMLKLLLDEEDIKIFESLFKLLHTDISSWEFEKYGLTPERVSNWLNSIKGRITK